jgi:hypothetical protein
MARITLTISLYGALRAHGGPVSLTAPSGITVAGVRELLAGALGGEALVADCALAGPDAVLTDDAVLSADCALAALPPVCGG